MTLTEGFLSGNVFIDLAGDIMYGSGQVNLNYPLRFATVGFQLVSTELLAEIADRIRIEAGYVPMHPVDEFREEDCDPDGWYDFYIDINEYSPGRVSNCIVYGKNLIDFKMERNIENVITGVHPYWKNAETGAVLELPEKVITASGKSIPYERIVPYDCTDQFESQPSVEALRSRAASYLKTTTLTDPNVDITIDFLQLWETPGYEDIAEAERVRLCDTVWVYISKLGIEVSSKVTETEYDTLLEKYKSVTLSNSVVSSRSSSLAASLGSIKNEASSAYQTAIRVETSISDV